MNSRLEKVRKLKLDVSEKASAPARRWVLWLLLAIVVAAGAFLALKDKQVRNSVSATVEASTASDYAAPATSTSAVPAEAPRLNRFIAVGYVEPIPPFPIHVSPLVLGRIDEFTITEGQPVKAGKIIAKLNSQEFEKRLAELQAALGVNAERLALAESELARSKRLSATGRQPGRNWSRPVRMQRFCGRRPRNSRPRFKASSGRFSKQRFARRSMEYCLSDWPTWAVSFIRTRSGKLLRSTTPRGCKYGWM
jgi:Biotin-lipoyl like